MGLGLKEVSFLSLLLGMGAQWPLFHQNGVGLKVTLLKNEHFRTRSFFRSKKLLEALIVVQGQH